MFKQVQKHQKYLSLMTSKLIYDLLLRTYEHYKVLGNSHQKIGWSYTVFQILKQKIKNLRPRKQILLMLEFGEISLDNANSL